MCDKFQTDVDLQKALSKDKEVLEKWNLKLPVFAVSTFTNMPHNQLVKTLMDS